MINKEVAYAEQRCFLSNGTKHDEKLLETTSKCISNYKTMIDEKQYIELIALFYSFLEVEFGFKKIKETANGNVFYDMEYKNRDKIVSISYENIESHLKIIVFILQNGKMPNYDDKTKTLHLRQLNELIINKVSKIEIESNTEYFSKYNVQCKLEKKLLKGAKELRLCLKHLL